jgi:hypothetical protein
MLHAGEHTYRVIHYRNTDATCSTEGFFLEDIRAASTFSILPEKEKGKGFWYKGQCFKTKKEMLDYKSKLKTKKSFSRKKKRDKFDFS